MYELMKELYPILRSITGDGVRETLKILTREIPLQIKEIPTGTKVFDWTIPKEWNLKEAYVKNSKGDKIIDINNSNLHILNYSVPVKKTVTLEELKQHLYSLEEYPDWIPYRTSYYNENWGFCLSYNQLIELEDDNYEVHIDSSLEKGNLTYGEYYIKGKVEDEVLISTHICHPSMCNDNLSGIVLAVFLAKYLNKLPLKYSYRFLFIPGTIGSIAWLSVNEKNVSKITHGLVATCLGDSGRFTYKRSRQGNSAIDHIVEYVLKESREKFNVIDFFPYGYDERQYCSPGFDLPVGCLMRTPHGQFPEYHTSADNISFINQESLSISLKMYVEVMNLIENNRRYLNLNPKCEPKLGDYGIYKFINGHEEKENLQLAIYWVLNLSDGNNTLLEISERSGLTFGLIKTSADLLISCGLLKELEN